MLPLPCMIKSVQSFHSGHMFVVGHLARREVNLKMNTSAPIDHNLGFIPNIKKIYNVGLLCT